MDLLGPNKDADLHIHFTTNSLCSLIPNYGSMFEFTRLGNVYVEIGDMCVLVSGVSFRNKSKFIIEMGGTVQFGAVMV